MNADKMHELTMLYLEKLKPNPGSPKEFVDEYYRIREEIQKSIKEYYDRTGKC